MNQIRDLILQRPIRIAEIDQFPDENFDQGLRNFVAGVGARPLDLFVQLELPELGFGHRTKGAHRRPFVVWLPRRRPSQCRNSASEKEIASA